LARRHLDRLGARPRRARRQGPPLLARTGRLLSRPPQTRVLTRALDVALLLLPDEVPGDRRPAARAVVGRGVERDEVNRRTLNAIGLRASAVRRAVDCERRTVRLGVRSAVGAGADRGLGAITVGGTGAGERRGRTELRLDVAL